MIKYIFDHISKIMKNYIKLSILLLLLSPPEHSITQDTWIKTYDFGGAEKGYDIIQSYDGNFWIVGESEGNDGKTGILYMKIDSSGEELLSMGAISEISLSGRKILELPDSTLLIFGTIWHSDKARLFIKATNYKEDILPWNEYSSDQSLVGIDIIRTKDSGFLLIGVADTTSVLFRLDANLDILWEKEILGVFHKAHETDHKDFMLTGIRKTRWDWDNYTTTGYVSLIDSIGTVKWSNNLFDNINGSRQLSNGNFIIVGSPDYSTLISLSSFLKLAQLDISGNILWADKYYGFAATCNDIESTISGDLLIIGSIDSSWFNINISKLSKNKELDIRNSHQLYFLKIDSQGNLIWERSYSDSLDQIAYAATELPDGSIMSVGTRYTTGNTSSDIIVIRMDHEGLVTGIESPKSPIQPTTIRLHQNYPNPFNPVTRIIFEIPVTARVSVTVYSVTGSEIKTLSDELRAPGLHEVSWDGTNNPGQKVSSGMYIYRIQAGEFTASKKMLLLK